MTVNPERLILAREVRGMLQPQLAQLTGIDQGSISRYEGGRRAVPDYDLDSIAQALEFPVEFFHRPGERYGSESGEIFHRKRKTVTISQLKRINAQLNIFRLNLETLLPEITGTIAPFDIPSYDVREFGGDIEAIAVAVRAAWKIPSGPILDLMLRLERAYCFIHLGKFDTNLIDETTQWCEPTPPVILANINVPGDRLRLTLAHTLGHLVMHHNRDPYLNMEEEANKFAGAFLMPAEDIESELRPVTIEHLLQLKPWWKVSMQALIKRAEDLGIITETRSNSLFQMLSRAGMRKKEPFPLDVEQPTLLKKIIRLYQAQGQYSVTELSEDVLAISERDFRHWYFPEEPYLQVATKKKQDTSGGFRSG